MKLSILISAVFFLKVAKLPEQIYSLKTCMKINDCHPSPCTLLSTISVPQSATLHSSELHYCVKHGDKLKYAVSIYNFKFFKFCVCLELLMQTATERFAVS